MLQWEVHASPAVHRCLGSGGGLPRWQQCIGRAKQAPPSLRGAWKVSSGSSDYALYQDTMSICCLYWSVLRSARKILFLLMR